MLIKSYRLTTIGADPIAPTPVATGATNGSIVRSLEICNNSGNAATVVVQRQDDGATPVVYGKTELNLDAGDYTVLFIKAQVVQPSGHALLAGSDQNNVDIIANVIEL